MACIITILIHKNINTNNLYLLKSVNDFFVGKDVGWVDERWRANGYNPFGAESGPLVLNRAEKFERLIAVAEGRPIRVRRRRRREELLSSWPAPAEEKLPE